MSKDYKQREAYKYLHGDLDKVHPNIERGWDRHNFDVGRFRKQRKEIKAKIHKEEYLNNHQFVSGIRFNNIELNS